MSQHIVRLIVYWFLITQYRMTFLPQQTWFLYNFHKYLIPHFLKSGGTKDHIRQVKVPGTA